MVIPSAEKLETILVVDDTATVLKTVASILEAANFHVLEASTGLEAMKIAADYIGRIDFLLSDVKMPEMSGPELGEALKKVRPDIRAMFMSGYSGGDILVLNYGGAFIQKPFLTKQLLAVVKVVLHTPITSQGSCRLDTRKGTGMNEKGQQPFLTSF